MVNQASIKGTWFYDVNLQETEIKSGDELLGSGFSC